MRDVAFFLEQITSEDKNNNVNDMTSTLETIQSSISLLELANKLDVTTPFANGLLTNLTDYIPQSIYESRTIEDECISYITLDYYFLDDLFVYCDFLLNSTNFRNYRNETTVNNFKDFHETLREYMDRLTDCVTFYDDVLQEIETYYAALAVPTVVFGTDFIYEEQSKVRRNDLYLIGGSFTNMV